MKPLKMQPFSHSQSIETLLKKRKDNSLLQNCLSFFQTLDKKRNESILNINESCKIIDTQFQPLQIKIKEYLRELINIPTYIDIPHNIDKVYDIQWKSDCLNQTYTNKSIHFEIACMYFNFAVLHMDYALTMYLSKFDYNKQMIVRILWTASWSFLKCVDFGNKCFKTGQMPIELDQKAVQMAYDLCQIIIHEIVYQQLSGDIANRDSPVLMQIQVKILKCCHRIIALIGQKEFWLWVEPKVIQDIVMEKYYVSRSLLYLPRIWFFRDQNKENPSSQGLPILVAIQEHMLSDIDSFEKFARQSDNKQLMDLCNQVKFSAQDYNNNTYLLQQVHKRPKGDIKQADLPQQYNEITPLEETDLFVKTQDYERIFMGEKSKYFKEIQNQIATIIAQKRETISTLRDGLIKAKNELYREFNLDAILQNQNQVYNQCQAIVQDIMQSKGGKQGYLGLQNKLREMQPEINKLLSQVQQMVVGNDHLVGKNGQWIDLKQEDINTYQQILKDSEELNKKFVYIEREMQTIGPVFDKILSGELLNQLFQSQQQANETESLRTMKDKCNQLEGLLQQGVLYMYKDIQKTLDQYNVLDRTVDILVGWKNQNDIENDLENTVSQSIVRYKDLVEQLGKGIIQMKNLAQQVKYENQNQLQTLQYRQNGIQTFKDIQILYDQELIGCLELQGKLSDLLQNFIQIQQDKILAQQVEATPSIIHPQTQQMPQQQPGQYNQNYPQQQQQNPYGFLQQPFDPNQNYYQMMNQAAMSFAQTLPQNTMPINQPPVFDQFRQPIPNHQYNVPPYYNQQQYPQNNQYPQYQQFPQNPLNPEQQQQNQYQQKPFDPNQPYNFQNPQNPYHPQGGYYRPN